MTTQFGPQPATEEVMKFQFVILERDRHGVQHRTECPAFEIKDATDDDFIKLQHFEMFINERSNVRLHVQEVG